MKKTILVLFLLIQAPVLTLGTVVYEWKDDNGVFHFTDNLRNVPQRYLNKARERDLGPSTPAPQGAPGGPTLPALQSPSNPTLYSGRTGHWWRDRFNSLRSEMTTLQQGLSAKEQRLNELRRRHLIFQRPQDRTAANNVAAEIEKDQARITELQGALKTLQQDADRAGVPAEWR